ncbi:hypothetical protein NSP_11680 [Nodularia spumigena CCY9414]|nr:hypothetical protein NSP_11680 [Nodularia spumigena CCY9414]
MKPLPMTNNKGQMTTPPRYLEILLSNQLVKLVLFLTKLIAKINYSASI